MANQTELNQVSFQESDSASETCKGRINFGRHYGQLLFAHHHLHNKRSLSHPGATETLSCSFTLPPVSGPPMIITCPTMTATADDNGNLSATSPPIFWLVSGCMQQAFSLSNGTATLTTPDNEVATPMRRQM